MLRLFIDHDFNHKILRGLKRRLANFEAELDYITTNDLGIGADADAEHLVRALEDERVILTHDVNTFTDAANKRLEAEQDMFGLIIVPQNMPIGQAIDELVIIVYCSKEDEFKNRSPVYLPLGVS